MTAFIDHSSTAAFEQYISPEVLAYLQEQQRLFDQQRSQLLQNYHEQFIWFENGQVLDADQDESALFLRVSAAHRDRPLFIAQVLPVEPKRMVRSRFLGMK